MTRLRKPLLQTSLISALALVALSRVARAQETLTLGLPAIPPVFVSVQAYVALQEKFFEKHGVKVVMRPFDSGANAARATVAGDVDFAISPTPLVINMNRSRWLTACRASSVAVEAIRSTSSTRPPGPAASAQRRNRLAAPSSFQLWTTLATR